MEPLAFWYRLDLKRAIEMRDQLTEWIDKVISERRTRKAANDKKRRSKRG